MRSDPVQSEIGQQWHLGNAFDGAIDAEGALKLISTLHQRRRTRIAIIDNAFDHGHIDFKSRVDARSGFFREEWGRGVKFVTGFNGLVAGSDQVEHGTFCAGMASANSGQSSPGRSGVSPDSELLLVACLIDQVGDQVSLARAIAYAADPRTENPDASKDAGADVISCSLGRNSASWRASGILKDAIGFAATAGRGGRGTPVFWAVQNLGANISSDQVCSLEDVIAVGACARDGKKQKVMAFGKKLAFLAPGVKVFGTMPVDAQGNRTGRAEGTSYAAPCAAGIAALILSVAPDLTRDEVVSIMKSKCVKTGDDSYLLGGRNDNYGFGRVDAKLAVEEARRIAEGSRSGGVIERALRFLGFQ
jgi:thermitase